MDKPNIILINCDDLGYGDLGCYGSEINATPYLDRMAAEGMLFTDYHVMSPVCSASRAALLTGCYPQRIGFPAVLFPASPIGLHPDEITIADVLKGQGYRTEMVGKWHCGDQQPFLPTRHGFESYYGLPYSNDMGIQGNPENHACRVPLPLLRDDKVIQEQPDQRGLTERYMEECVRFIREQKDAPFFLYLAHMYVHVPLFVPQRFMAQSRNGGYGGAVECIDWATGMLFETLRRQGLDENTLVIFTSDNGSRAGDEGGSNAPLRGNKATTWEGGQRVPCIIRWPGKVPAGRVCRELVTAMDFLPTLATLAGTRQPEDRRIDGKDITPLLYGQEGASSPHQVFYYYIQDRLQAVRKGKWKLHFVTGAMFAREPKPTRELYNLEQDVGETRNVYDEYPRVVAALQAAADAARAELGDTITGVEGSGRRPVGEVSDPVPLAVYDPDHPYIVAAYDKPDSKVMAG